MTAAVPPTDAARDDGRDGPLGPPGWHADPWQRHVLRFYDGRLWTEHVADGGVAGLDTSPVARMERSHPTPVRSAPPEDPVGARVLPRDAAPTSDEAARTDAAPLLLVGAPDDVGERALRTPDDRAAGRIVLGPPGAMTRLGQVLVTDPSTTVTRLRVLDAGGDEVVCLTRPRHRTAAVVDVTGPSGPLGTVAADRVVRELRARVVAADGREVGTLTQAAGETSALAVTDEGGTRRARLTPVWDVPGQRHHLPPGALLLDRRPPPGEPWDTSTASLLLGAALAPVLLRPPRPPS